MVNINEAALPSPDELLSSQSVASLSFKDAKVGDSFTGIITDTQTVQVRNFATGDPEFWEDGKPKLQIAVTLQTEYNDPTIEDDNGERRVYLFGQKLTAAKAALKEAGLTKLENGTSFTISLAGEKPAKTKGFNPVKLYGIELVKGKSNPDVDALLADAGAKPVAAKAKSAKLADDVVAKVKKLQAGGFNEEEIADALSLNVYDVKAVTDETF